MFAQRASTLVALLFLPLALPTGLSASVATGNPSAGASLRVSDDNGHQVNVRLVGGEGWYVLGRVHNDATRVFKVPRALVGMRGIEVFADPLNQFTGFQSKAIATRTGEKLHLVVTRPATASRFSVA